MRIQILILGFKGLTTSMVSTILAAPSAFFSRCHFESLCLQERSTVEPPCAQPRSQVVPRVEKRDLGTSFPFATPACSPTSVQNNLKN